ncbi:Trichodiene synthase [Trichoderma austrokoningii]
MAESMNIDSPAFPKDYFIKSLVQLLDAIDYKDTNFSRDERVDRLQYVYRQAADHFSQPCINAELRFNSKKLEAGIRTISLLVVDCWVALGKQEMADLTIYFTYTLILDDSGADPRQRAETVVEDMATGRKQKHPWLRLMNEHLPKLTSHYGPYCSLGIYRSTIDFFASGYIERNKFQGLRGNDEFPEFLRRMNGLGHVVGTSIFPADKFDESGYFREITTSMCQLECWEAWVNDMLSFYKEFDNPRDESSLVNNYCMVSDLTLQEGLEKVTENTLRITKQIMRVIADWDSRVKNIITRFMHGYITWHLCDRRYRLSEVYEFLRGDDAVSVKFRQYYEEAYDIGWIDPAEWTRPTFLELVRKQDLRQTLLVERSFHLPSMDVTRSLQGI